MIRTARADHKPQIVSIPTDTETAPPREGSVRQLKPNRRVRVRRVQKDNDGFRRVELKTCDRLKFLKESVENRQMPRGRNTLPTVMVTAVGMYWCWFMTCRWLKLLG